jgi:hypothetical protein
MTTPNLGLSGTTEAAGSAVKFLDWRLAIDGTSNSNNTKIDSWVGGTNASLVLLNNFAIISASAVESTPGNYTATISSIAAYAAGLTINLTLDTTTIGTTTLAINALGTKSIYKISDGVAGNLEAGDLVGGRPHLIQYTSGGYWLWESGTSMDQVATVGITNNLIMISPCAVLIDSGVQCSACRISGSYVNLVATGIVAGSYTALEVDTYGRAISGSILFSTDANLSLSNITSASIPVDFNPDINNTRNLGSAVKSWLSGFINKITMTSGSVSTPSASQVALYNTNKLLYSKDEDGLECFVSQKKKGNFFIVYPNPTITNGATAATQVELTAGNYTNFNTVNFSYSGSPTGTVQFALPWDYDGGSFTSNFYFSTSGSVSGSSVDVKLGICGRAYASGDLLDQAPSSFVYATKTSASSANKFFISPTTGSFSVSGSPSPLNLVSYIIQRDNSVADNLQTPIMMNGIMINYTRAQN